MILGFLDSHIVFVIVHLLGLAVGAGGAFASDAMFFLSAKDKKITATELKFLHLGGAMVWLGLGILAASGTMLFLEDPAGYLASGKFLAKMTIVAVIAANGILFHKLHLPMLRRLEADSFSASKEFRQKSSLLLASGALSAVSWISALTLGALRGIPYSYWVLMAVYLLFVFGAILFALSLKRRLFFT